MVLFFRQPYVFFWRSREGPSRGGGVLPYISHTGYVLPHRVGFLRRSGLKTGIQFAHFGLESGIVFEGTKGVYERTFTVSIPNESERKRNMQIRNGFE